MKTARASIKAGKKSTSAQSAIVPKIEPGEAPKETLTLSLWSTNAKAEVLQITIPDDLASYLRCSIAAENPNLGAFIVQALRERISRDAMKFPLNQLESAVQEALLMLDSTRTKLLDIYGEEMSSRSPSFNQQTTDLICAYNGQLHAAALALHRAYQATTDYLQAKAAS